MYTNLASWFHLVTDPASYAEEAAFFRRALLEHGKPRPRTLLELGSGGGNNASHLKKHFAMTLVDLSSDMLKLSKTINPGLEHVQGDMRTVRLGRQFDAVFVHDAVMYMTTERDLKKAIVTAYAHTRPCGVALFVPDFTREMFRPRTDCGGHDKGKRGLRYLEWTWDEDPDDTHATVDFAYLLREPNGTIRVAHDRHTFGVFPRRDWLRLLREAGFRPRALSWEHSDAGKLIAFLGVRT
jgi:ubiquinone/menaquinone biosynthesis C-methylase UbiE